METIIRAAGGEALTRPDAFEAPITLTISQAALACGVNRRTIRRRREAGDFPGAYQDDEGIWHIPVSDLESAGLPPYMIDRLGEPPEATQLDRLRGEVALLRERLQAMQTIARERQERIEDLRLVLRMLPGGAEPVAQPTFRFGDAREPMAGGVGGRALASRSRGVLLGSEGSPGGPRRGREEAGAGAPALASEETETLIRLPEPDDRGPAPRAADAPSRSAQDQAIWLPGGAPYPDPDPSPSFPESPLPPRLPRDLLPRRWRLGWRPWRRYRG